MRLQCALQILPILILVGCAILSSAQGTDSSTSSACFDIFASEFEESKITCKVSAADSACRCKFQVLDLSACVLDYVSNGDREDPFNLVVSEIVSNVASSKYTSAFRDAFEQHGSCKLRCRGSGTMALKSLQLKSHSLPRASASR